MPTKLTASGCDPTICSLLDTARNNSVSIILIVLSLAGFIYSAKYFLLFLSEKDTRIKSDHLSFAAMAMGVGVLFATGGILTIFNGAGPVILNFFGIK